MPIRKKSLEIYRMHLVEWWTLKIETNEINQVPPHIPSNNITELYVYAGAKLVCEKIGIPLKSEK